MELSFSKSGTILPKNVPAVFANHFWVKLDLNDKHSILWRSIEQMLNLLAGKTSNIVATSNENQTVIYGWSFPSANDDCWKYAALMLRQSEAEEIPFEVFSEQFKTHMFCL